MGGTTQVVEPAADNDFSLRDLIRETITAGASDDPGVIAAMVAAKVPADKLRAALTLALRDMVRHEYHHFGTWFKTPEPEPEPEPKRQPAGKNGKAPVIPKQPFRSAKVQGYQAWSEVLWKPVAVAGNQWKKFGECGILDLRFLASDRRGQAALSTAAAIRFEKYEQALIDHDKQTVAALPDDVISEIEGRPTP